MKRRDVHLVSAAIVRDGTCLVIQRGPEMTYAGRWELPGGKVEPGERPRDALRREVQEELDVEIIVGPLIARATSHPGRRDFMVEVYEIVLTYGRPELREHAQQRWIQAASLEDLDWAEPLEPIVEAIRAHLEVGRGPLWPWAIAVPALDEGAALAGAAVAWSVASLSWFLAAQEAWNAAYAMSLAASRAAFELVLPGCER